MQKNGLQQALQTIRILGGAVNRFFKNQEGATAIEYALICALIVIVCVAAMTALGSSSNGLWGKVNSNVSSKL